MAKPQPQPTASTQSNLPIVEIKDGVVVMNDGSLRAVILASAINFDLMSTQEQEAVEYAYQGFLNSLHFPVQISIKSERVALDGYIEKLSQARNTQTNPLLMELMDDYIANIRSLVEEVNIMDKRFYVVVPFFPPLTVTKTGLASGINNVFKPTGVIRVSSHDFERYKKELAQRVQQVANALAQLGVRAIPLNTQELIDLYYNCYNPDVAQTQQLMDAGQFEGPAVTRGGGELESPAITAASSGQPLPPGYGGQPTGQENYGPQAGGPSPAQQPQNPLEDPRRRG